MLISHDDYGVVLMAGEITKLYNVNGGNYKLLCELNNYAPGKQGHGGQSKERLERRRLEYYNEYYKRIHEKIKMYYIDSGTSQANIKGLILAGPALTKNKVMDHESFDTRLKKIVKKILSTTEITEITILNIIVQMDDLLCNDNDETKLIVERFNNYIATNANMSVYGPNTVLKCLSDNQLKYLLVHQSYFDQNKDIKERLELTCKNNGCQIYISNAQSILTYGGICGILWYANKYLYEEEIDK